MISIRARIRFGDFELDLHSQELRKKDRRLRLSGQPLQVLRILLETPGDLVTRDQLRQALWPGNNYGDFDHGLNAAITRLREVLGDSAENPIFIETVPRRGYRFIGRIETNDLNNHQLQDQQVVSKSTRTPIRWLRTPWLALGVIGLAVVVVGSVYAYRRLSTHAPPRVVGMDCLLLFDLFTRLFVMARDRAIAGPQLNSCWRVRQQHPARRKLTINHGDFCRYPTTRRVASSTSVPTASSGSISERRKTAVWASASIDVTHTNAASPKSTMRSSSLWPSR